MGKCCIYNSPYTNAASYPYGGTNPASYPYAGTNAASYPYAGTNPSSGGTPNYASPYACSCSTSYPQYVRVIQSVASTVSTITSWLISATATIGSFRVKTSGTQITTQVYSDPSLVTQIGSDLVYTATGAVVTSDYGILVKPSTYSQGYTIGPVTIDRN